MYMHVFCMASVLHHTSFLTTRLTFMLRGLVGHAGFATNKYTMHPFPAFYLLIIVSMVLYNTSWLYSINIPY